MAPHPGQSPTKKPRLYENADQPRSSDEMIAAFYEAYEDFKDNYAADVPDSDDLESFLGSCSDLYRYVKLEHHPDPEGKLNRLEKLVDLIDELREDDSRLRERFPLNDLDAFPIENEAVLRFDEQLEEALKRRRNRDTRQRPGVTSYLPEEKWWLFREYTKVQQSRDDYEGRRILKMQQMTARQVMIAFNNWFSGRVNDGDTHRRPQRTLTAISQQGQKFFAANTLKGPVPDFWAEVDQERPHNFSLVNPTFPPPAAAAATAPSQAEAAGQGQEAQQDEQAQELGDNEAQQEQGA